MNNKTIEVVVRPDGSLWIDAVGFQGADCEKATAFLEQALGQAAERKRKPEYLAHASSVQRQRVGR